MIDKKILFSSLVITLLAGCDAGEKIQDVIDDVKADYIDEVVSDVVDNSNSDKALSGDNIAIDEQIDSLYLSKILEFTKKFDKNLLATFR